MATFTDQQNTDLNTAYQRQQANPTPAPGTVGAPTATNAGDAANLKYAMANGWKPTSTPTTPITVPNSADASQLGQTKPIVPVPPPVDETNSFVAGIKSAGDQLKAAQEAAPATSEVNNLQQQSPGLFQRVIDAMKAKGGQGTALVNAEAAAGVPDQQKKLADLNTQISQVSSEFDNSIQGLSAGTGLSTTIAGKQGQLQRQKAVLLGGLSSQAQAIQGNIAAAQATAKRTVDLEFQDAQNNIDIAKAQLDNNYQNLTSAEKKQADQLSSILTIRQQQLDEQKADKQNIYSVMLEAAKNGADQQTLNNIRGAKTVEDAIAQAGSSLSTDTKDFGIIGKTTNADGSTKDVYGFIDKKTGKVTAIDGTALGSVGDWITGDSTNTSKGVVTTSTGDAYNIGSYATDPNHEKSVQNILTNMGQMTSVQQMDQYIQNIAPGSPVTGQMIADASAKYGTSWEAMMAIMQQDSQFGTQGKATTTNNPGNVGNTDNGSTNKLPTWQAGVDAVAKNLAGRKVDPSTIVPGTPLADRSDEISARNYASGKLNPSALSPNTSRSAKNQRYTNMIVQRVQEINPDFNPATAVVQWNNAMDSTNQHTLIAINRVLPNIDSIVSTSNDFSRGNYTPLNSLLQKAGIISSNKTVANLGQAQKLIGDELGTALGSGSGSDLKTKLGLDVVDSSLSPETFASNMQQLKDYLNNNKGAIRDSMGIYAPKDTLASTQTMGDGSQWKQNSDGSYTRIK